MGIVHELGSVPLLSSSSTSLRRRLVSSTRFDRAPEPVVLEKGVEMGRFRLGSTVVLLFARDRVRWLPGVLAGSRLRMGETIAEPLSAETAKAES